MTMKMRLKMKNRSHKYNKMVLGLDKDIKTLNIKCVSV